MTPLRRIAVIGNSLPRRVRPGKRNGRSPAAMPGLSQLNEL
jgi:hypothetical protein